jgi:DNA-binding YbaB/EbfC family protein
LPFVASLSNRERRAAFILRQAQDERGHVRGKHAMDMEELMRQAQQAAEAIQKQMSDVQVKLDSLEVEGSSGGGLVKIRATAKGRILSVSIDDSLIVPADKQMLEDLVTAAFNDARTKADQAAETEMQKAQSGMGLPPGLKLPGMG